MQDIRTLCRANRLKMFKTQMLDIFLVSTSTCLLHNEDHFVLHIFQQIRMMMHLLIRDEKDGILCPIPSHSLYTSSVVLQGATLVCTALIRKKKTQQLLIYYDLPIVLRAKHICFLRYHITLMNLEVGE